MSLRNLARGAALGAGVMYFFDPVRGRLRRQQINARMRRFVHRVDRELDTFARDFRNRMRGFKSEMRTALRDEPVSDDTLVDRVRSQLGHAVSQPKAIDVTAGQGRVVLSGAVPASEISNVLQCVAGISGVACVENQLEVQGAAGSVPAGQGESRASSRVATRSAGSSLTHLGVTLAGAGLVAFAAPRSFVTGGVLGALGLMLLSNEGQVREHRGTNGGHRQRQRPRKMSVAEEAQTSAVL